MVPDAPRPWTWLRQVHGADVVVVEEPGQHAGSEADAAVTVTPGCALVVRTADCCPIVVTGERGVGVIHAGWRGLRDGIVGAAVEALRRLDPSPLRAHLGPCIRPGCYEFDGPDRAEVLARLGPDADARTTWGTPAIDLPAGVRVALTRAGVDEIDDSSGCTACDRRWYSHRARGETERFATVAWVPR